MTGYSARFTKKYIYLAHDGNRTPKALKSVESNVVDEWFTHTPEKKLHVFVPGKFYQISLTQETRRAPLNFFIAGRWEGRLTLRRKTSCLINVS
jgi:hypothetical protein